MAGRYSESDLRIVRDSRGREVAVRSIRVGRSFPIAGRHRVREGERLDHVAHAYLGDSTATWALVDANAGMTMDQLRGLAMLLVPIRTAGGDR